MSRGKCKNEKISTKLVSLPKKCKKRLKRASPSYTKSAKLIVEPKATQNLNNCRLSFKSEKGKTIADNVFVDGGRQFLNYMKIFEIIIKCYKMSVTNGQYCVEVLNEVKDQSEKNMYIQTLCGLFTARN